MKNNRFVKIQGETDLYKDQKSGANVSFDESGFKARIRSKTKMSSLEERVLDLEKRFSILERNIKKKD